jgi:pimeloyl-ACP methyl ester carboxylesterase
VFGSSGGAMLALQAAARGLPITRLVVWEPPYIVGDSRPPAPADYREQLESMLAQGRRGDMVELFMTAAAGIPAEYVAPIRQMPGWAAMEAVAHTLVYDATVAGDFSLPVSRLAGATVPTLVLDGGTTPWLSAAAEAAAGVLPDARRATLTGQQHNVDPAAIAPVIAEFFGG